MLRHPHMMNSIKFFENNRTNLNLPDMFDPECRYILVDHQKDKKKGKRSNIYMYLIVTGYKICTDYRRIEHCKASCLFCSGAIMLFIVKLQKTHTCDEIYWILVSSCLCLLQKNNWYPVPLRYQHLASGTPQKSTLNKCKTSGYLAFSLILFKPQDIMI